MDEQLHHLIPQVRYVQAPGLGLRDRAVPVRPGAVLCAPSLGCFLNFIEIAPEPHIVHFREKIVVDGLAGELPVPPQRLRITRLDLRPAHHILISGRRCRRRYELLFRVLGVVM